MIRGLVTRTSPQLSAGHHYDEAPVTYRRCQGHPGSTVKDTASEFRIVNKSANLGRRSPVRLLDARR